MGSGHWRAAPAGQNEKRLWIALFLTTTFLTAEIVGGILERCRHIAHPDILVDLPLVATQTPVQISRKSHAVGGKADATPLNNRAFERNLVPILEATGSPAEEMSEKKKSFGYMTARKPILHVF